MSFRLSPPPVPARSPKRKTSSRQQSISSLSSSIYSENYDRYSYHNGSESAKSFTTSATSEYALSPSCFDRQDSRTDLDRHTSASWALAYPGQTATAAPTLYRLSARLSESETIEGNKAGRKDGKRTTFSWIDLEAQAAAAVCGEARSVDPIAEETGDGNEESPYDIDSILLPSAEVGGLLL